MSRSERFAFVLAVAASLVLRGLAFFNYRFDSDEAQHLHVTWGWTAGLIQYRDVFDNHTPLFHMATAPILVAVGERSTVLFFMRGVMLPLFAIVIAATFVVARRMYSRRVALWAAVLLSLFPPFFLKSLEYRTDNLWNAIWMIVLIVLTAAPPSPKRMFAAGFLLGLGVATSMKTLLLIVTLAGAALIARWILRDGTAILRNAVAALAGFVIVPAALAMYFVSRGAWADLVYCVVGFNSGVSETRLYVWVPRILYPFVIALIIFVARRSGVGDPLRLYMALTTAVFVATLAAFWILISPRDFLPVMPLVAIFLAAAIERRPRASTIYAATSIVFLASLFYYAERFVNHTRQYTTMIDQVLRLSRPGEPLMDIKGETIFRRRPFYYAFEAITREKMSRGLIADTVPESMIAARCYVAQAEGPMLPPRARRFLNDNFMDMGRLRAAGQWIRDDGSFSIAIPGDYVVVNETGEAKGSLDETAYQGARTLQAGRHRFNRAVPGERVAILWAGALQRGFSPFHLKDREF